MFKIINSFLRNGGGGEAPVKQMRIFLVFLAFYSILFSFAQLWNESRALCN
jgi:hypothetical protein